MELQTAVGNGGGKRRRDAVEKTCPLLGSTLQKYELAVLERKDYVGCQKPMTKQIPAPTTWVHLSQVTQSCPTLCDLMDCSMPGFPIHHQLLELAQIHVHRVGDAIQQFHPLSSPSPPSPLPYPLPMTFICNLVILRILYQ